MGLKNFQVKNVDVNTHLLLRIKFGQYLVSSEFLWSKQAFVMRLDDLMTIVISTLLKIPCKSKKHSHVFMPESLKSNSKGSNLYVQD